ncbi:MAG: hypothetical protein HYZ84_03015 [Candidatus Omnitrophica bacterium]|nr:hypothetical protein [Candidatus Omnitrophota bacterium]
MKVALYYSNAGHGHQKVAEVIAKTFLERGLKKTDVDLRESLGLTPPSFRHTYPAIYYYAVKYIPGIWGWFYEKFDIPKIYSLVQPIRELGNALHSRRLLAHIKSQKPDVIISTHFFPSEVIARAKREKKIEAKLMTVVTDFLPHSFWINEGTDYYWVMGHEGKAFLEARGVPAEKIIAGGIPVDHEFKPSGNKKDILAKWRLDPERFTILLTSGSFGLGPQEAILRELENFKDRVQCFMVAGNNHTLKSSLEKMQFGYPIRILGFVDFMPELMEASDLIVAKTGGATTTESLVKGLPMVVLSPIPGQESRNANILKEHNAAFFLEKPEQIKLILQAIFEHPELMEAKRKALHAVAKPHAADDLVSFVIKTCQNQNKS